jgi:hypothetical protein
LGDYNFFRHIHICFVTCTPLWDPVHQELCRKKRNQIQCCMKNDHSFVVTCNFFCINSFFLINWKSKFIEKENARLRLLWFVKLIAWWEGTLYSTFCFSYKLTFVCVSNFSFDVYNFTFSHLVKVFLTKR